MKTILTKFKVASTTDFGDNSQEVKMTAVISGSEENKSFSKYTPSGDIRLHITNPEILDFFIAGEEYYVRLEKSYEPVPTK